ncbi:MAG: glycosyltransferase [Hyphomicrobiaceae bacterium]
MALLFEALAPGFLVLGFAWMVLPWLKAEDERARAAMVAIMLVLMWRYMAWRWMVTLPPVGLTLDFAVGVTFVTVETLVVAGATISLTFLVRLTNRTPDADRNQSWLMAQAPPPLVDVFICTYNEEEAILERTIVGALALDYPRYRVWVLDDGRRPWLEALAARLGAHYLTRPDNAHAKAGNINNGLRHVATLPEPPDFISILDADFVPAPHFLRRALSLFREDDVGIVQTPQHFINPDPLQSNLSIARVWPDEQRYFFDVVMASKDAWGASFCCGTSSVIRFPVLQQIGGFPTESVTEDYLVTLKMKAAGYRTVYLNERLSLGLAPEGLKEYVTQRSRWALGFVQIYRGALGPFRRNNGLSLMDRVSLTETFLYWSAAHSFRLLGIIIPILYLLFNVHAVQADVIDTLGYYLPYFISQITIMGWMARGRVMPIMSDVTQLLAAAQITRAVAHGLIKPKGHKFHVTAKGGDRSRRFIQWPLMRVFLIYLALTIAGLIWAFIFEDGHKLRDSAALCLFWSWYNIVVLTIACIVCIEQPRLRASERLSARGMALIDVDGNLAEARVLDVSLGGARLAGPSPAPVGTGVTVVLDGMSIRGTLLRAGAESYVVRFEETAETKAKLIRFVYSGRFSADVPRIVPARVAAATLGRVMR